MRCHVLASVRNLVCQVSACCPHPWFHGPGAKVGREGGGEGGGKGGREVGREGGRWEGREGGRREGEWVGGRVERVRGRIVGR